MRLKIATCVLAFVAFGLTARTAEAAPIALQLSSGATTFTILDGGALDANPLDGVITFVGAVEGWLINISTGIGTGLSPNYMDLNSVNTSPLPTTSTLTINFSQINNLVAFPGMEMEFGGTVTNSSVIYNAFFNNANTFFGGTLIGSLGPFSAGGFTGTTSGFMSATSPFSLTQQFLITGGGGTLGSAFSGNAELNPVPEPGSLLLLGGGLLGLAGLARRRRQKKSGQ
jgi:hypothetical protein